MLVIERFGPVTRFRMGRRVLGVRSLTVHAFLVDGLLIDTGGPPTARELVQALAGERVEQVVLTHHHEDHVGGAPALCQARGLTPRIHPDGLGQLARPRRLALYRQVVWGQPRPVAGQALGREVTTERYRFQVLHTPGHAPDHVALYEPDQGWLFVGDLLIHPRLPTLRRADQLPAWMESLRRVAALPAEQVFCSHYPRVVGPEALAAKWRFWTELAERAADLRRQGLPPERIRTRLLGREGWLPLLTAGQFSKLNLIRALLRLDPAE